MCSIFPDLTPTGRPPDTVTLTSELAEGPIATPREAAQLQARAQQLRQVANRIEEFLIRQIDRLQGAIAESAAADGQAEMGLLRDDFQRQRDKWEADRQLEIEQLREDARRLAEAWKHLESEQRELLMRQATIRTMPPAVVSEAEACAENGPLHPVRLSPTGTVAAVGAAVGCVGNAATMQKAQLQFQQLRREMQRHAQQRKKY